MKSNKLKIVICIGLMILIVVMCRRATSCFDDGKKLGIYQSSNNIRESKENKVYVKELKVDKEFIMLNNNKIKFEECWLEHGWTYECINDQITVVKNMSSQHVNIKLKNVNWGVYMDWYISEFGNDLGGSVNGNIIFFLNESHPSQNLIRFYRLQKKYEFKGKKFLVDSIRIN